VFVRGGHGFRKLKADKEPCRGAAFAKPTARQAHLRARLRHGRRSAPEEGAGRLLENSGILGNLVRCLAALSFAAARERHSSFCMAHTSVEVPGLTAHLDRLVHHHGGKCLPEGTPHAFVYFITIKNDSDRVITLFGRKWMIQQTDGNCLVIEGDKIVGESPRLAPGERFSYNSYHVTGCGARAHGIFHGIDEFGGHVHVTLAPFEMVIPEE
jgi:ApaG protein